jgi:hypothetical protein
VRDTCDLDDIREIERKCSPGSQGLHEPAQGAQRACEGHDRVDAVAHRSTPPVGSTEPSPQRPRDHQALDLVRALVDLRDLRVAQHPLDRVLLDVALPAEHLHRLGGDPHGGLRSGKLRLGGELRHLADLLLGVERVPSAV